MDTKKDYIEKYIPTVSVPAFIAEFERFCKENGQNVTKRKFNDSYLYANVQFAYLAWCEAFRVKKKPARVKKVISK